MRHYLIADDHVTALSTPPEAVSEGQVLVQKAGDLDVRRFPLPRLLALHNALPGAKPAKRFTDRKAGLKRLWEAFEGLPLARTRSDSKQARAIALMRRPEGCSIEELTKATGWQPHSVRGMLSGVLRKKLGMTVECVKDGNMRTYRIPA